MSKKKLSFRSKLILIVLPFIIIVGASIYSTNNLLNSLNHLSLISLKNIEGHKAQALVTYCKDLEISFSFLSYHAKDAILKKLAKEDSPSDGFMSALDSFTGQLSQVTGQLSSTGKEDHAKKMKETFSPIQAELLKWGGSFNSQEFNGSNANSEFKEIRKKLKEFIKNNTDFKADDGEGALAVFNFISTAQSKFKILNWVFVVMSCIVLIFCLVILAQMTKILDGIIENLKIQFNKLDDVSNDLVKQSDELSAGTQEQASSIQETVSTMEEITAMVRSNTQVAESSTNAAVENTNMAKMGVRTIENMVDSITGVRKFSEELPKDVEKSSAEFNKIINVMNEISNKTKVINDIVFQTKLLSFNASVEAARAGEQGKGFSVVAEEVGNLAQMSAKASDEISQLLESSTKIVQETVEKNRQDFMKSASDITARVNESFEKASECTGILNSIEKKANAIGELMNEISIASNEQTKGIEGINDALKQLDQTSLQNSLVANETAKMGSDLKENARGLEVVLGQLSVFLNGSGKSLS